ncbi:hypothetical protein NDU88_001709 [Pleurodeles waltl]|uniref:Uncharacterized protein n=1 Tax=Pleurodeles waltl TaxID=8319 RepID=A0AAV7T0N4_PLEWA|nr:hypothetical protein NDU88_001709 [Pleurodeles waltl]
MVFTARSPDSACLLLFNILGGYFNSPPGPVRARRVPQGRLHAKRLRLISRVQPGPSAGRPFFCFLLWVSRSSPPSVARPTLCCRWRRALGPGLIFTLLLEPPSCRGAPPPRTGRLPPRDQPHQFRCRPRSQRGCPRILRRPVAGAGGQGIRMVCLNAGGRR